mgnify:FL=1
MGITEEDKLAADKKKGGIACPKCDRKDMLAITRKREIIEYKKINTKKKLDGGIYGYKANWKQEEAKVKGKQGIRCMACEEDITLEDMKDMYDEINITPKGVWFVRDMFSKLFGGDDASRP